MTILSQKMNLCDIGLLTELPETCVKMTLLGLFKVDIARSKNNRSSHRQSICIDVLAK